MKTQKAFPLWDNKTTAPIHYRGWQIGSKCGRNGWYAFGICRHIIDGTDRVKQERKQTKVYAGQWRTFVEYKSDGTAARTYRKNDGHEKAIASIKKMIDGKLTAEKESGVPGVSVIPSVAARERAWNAMDAFTKARTAFKYPRLFRLGKLQFS